MPIILSALYSGDRAQYCAVAAILLLAMLPGCATEPDWLSGPEIRAALADHTAMLPGGFVEYYAPDGTVRGWSDGQPYTGVWEVKQDAFCTALSGDPPVCSRVARAGHGLAWSIDGEKRLSRVDDIVPGNPRGL
jgi:hypothetical protein